MIFVYKPLGNISPNSFIFQYAKHLNIIIVDDIFSEYFNFIKSIIAKSFVFSSASYNSFYFRIFCIKNIQIKTALRINNI